MIDDEHAIMHLMRISGCDYNTAVRQLERQGVKLKQKILKDMAHEILDPTMQSTVDMLETPITKTRATRDGSKVSKRS